MCLLTKRYALQGVTSLLLSDELVKADIDWDIESIIGTSVAGFIIGVCINGVIFIHTLQKALLTKAEFAPKET
jgi:hypothetical protein